MTRAEPRIARVEDGEPAGSVFLVRSPAVGVARGLPEEGHYLNPAQAFMTLRIRGRDHVVRLPPHVHGHVAERFVEESHVPVAYDEPLLRLARGPASAEPAAGVSGAAAAGGGEGGGEGLLVVPSPSDGIFYRRPNPQEAPYVEEGSVVRRGSVLGLVEAMKTFYQILYDDPDLPEEGTVAEIRAEDAAEVRFGAPLFLIRPSAGNG